MECKVSSRNKHDFCCHYFNDSEDIVSCYSCDKDIISRADLAIGCKTCNYWLHDLESCLEKKLAPTILHPFHPQHQLTLTYTIMGFVCKECSYLVEDQPRYECNICNFKIDIVCASFAINNHYYQLLEAEDRNFKQHEEKAVLRIRYHKHPLELFKFKFGETERSYFSRCFWCYKPLYGICYGCLRLECQFYLHQFCTDMILQKRLEHPFHPSHPLYLRYNISKFHCKACKERLSLGPLGTELVYWCDKCRFGLHCNCASLLPTLKLERRHNHPLTYVDPSMFGNQRRFLCDECKSDCLSSWNTDLNAFYRCVECDFNLHFGCLQIPTEAKSKYHRHALVIKTGVIIEDYSGKYYCDICEEERDLTHYVYYCEECKFIAHIHCVLNEKRGGAPLMIKAMEEDRVKDSDEEFLALDQMQILRSLHEHPLSVFEAINKKFRMHTYCNVCSMEILGPAYGCNDCKYYIHKACGELPHQIMSNPVHMQHPLTLFSFENDGFICDKCEDVSYAYGYFCPLCNFKLDLKCATDTKNFEDQNLKPKSIFFHFVHYHPLASCNISGGSSTSFYCDGCLVSILGLAYCCLECQFFLHQSCYVSLPRAMQCPLHPLVHTMEAVPFSQYSHLRECYACELPFPSNQAYRCLFESNEFLFHFSCLKSLRKVLKSNFHKHDLYYFGTGTQNMFLIMDKTPCLEYDRFRYRTCGEICDGSFYRCVKCKINFHLECLPIPQAIKSKQHIHPLILKDSFIDDDFGEYYCDVCEEERDSKHHVYYCEECLFVTHIECILNKVNPHLYKPL